jgi:arsenite methyltransferase
MPATIDVAELRAKVQQMYRDVAQNPGGGYHFDIGRALAERLGYPPPILDQIPTLAVESFAGVGYFFDLAALTEGDKVLDLGSGSGMDSFVAHLRVRTRGNVTGVDMTRAQLDKAERLRTEAGLRGIDFVEGHIEDRPFPSTTFDVVISNGVINLAPNKATVFAEAARVLRPGGRLAIADIVTETQLPDQIVSNADLWASCIGGATHQDTYQQVIEAAGFTLERMKRNPYQFLSERARNASIEYGVRSLSLLARKS